MSETEAYRSGRVVLDLTMSADRVVRIDEMNGHQGEDGRVVQFALVGQNGLPEDITNKTIDLLGVDSAGKTKISGNTETVVNPSMGWFDFTIPSAFYQQVGDYDRAYFRVKDNASGNISTVNVMFSVIQGIGYLTQSDSQIYNGNVDSQMADIEQKVATFTQDTNSLLTGTANAAQIANQSLNAVLQAVKTNQMPTLSGNNTFTGQNTFQGTVSIDNLSGGAIDKLNQQFNDLSLSVTNTLSTFNTKLPNYTDSWSRDYTWGPGLSKPNNGNDFALSRLLITNNLCVIFGRGDVLINKNDADYWETTLTIPWQVNSATMMIADWHTSKGYFKPYHDISSSNTISASCSGRYTNETYSLNIIMIGAPA